MDSFLVPTNANNGDIYKSLANNTKIFKDEAQATLVLQRPNVAIECVYGAAKRACSEPTWAVETQWVKVVEQNFKEDIQKCENHEQYPHMIIEREYKVEKGRID